MLLQSLTVAAAGLAGTTTAFLIPPEISHSVVNTMPVDMPSMPAGVRVVKVDCPGCPVQWLDADANVHVEKDMENHLLLGFRIDRRPDSDRLLVNDYEIFPNPDPLARRPLFAPQGMRDTAYYAETGTNTPNAMNTKIPRLGYSLHWRPLTEDKESHMELISVDFQVIEVHDAFVNGIPSVHVKLVKTENGGLVMGDIQVTASQTVQSNPMDKQEECTTAVCKWRAIIADRLRNFKPHGCGGKVAKFGQHKGKEQHRPRPGGHHHSHHNHHHGPLREHSWGQLFKKLGSHILFPVFIGIVAGVSASM